MLFHCSAVEIMLDGGHTRVTEGRQTMVKVVGALFSDWSRDETVWVVKLCVIFFSIEHTCLYA